MTMWSHFVSTDHGSEQTCLGLAFCIVVYSLKLTRFKVGAAALSPFLGYGSGILLG